MVPILSNVAIEQVKEKMLLGEFSWPIHVEILVFLQIKESPGPPDSITITIGILSGNVEQELIQGRYNRAAHLGQTAAG